MIKISYLALTTLSKEPQDLTETTAYDASKQNSLTQSMRVYEGTQDTRLLRQEFEKTIQQLQEADLLPSIPSNIDNKIPNIDRSPTYLTTYARNQLKTEIPILPRSIKPEEYKIEIVEWPTSGAAVVNSDGTISYLHLLALNLSDRIVYRLTDKKTGQTSDDVVLDIIIENNTTFTETYAGYRGYAIKDCVALKRNSQTTVDLLENYFSTHRVA